MLDVRPAEPQSRDLLTVYPLVTEDEAELTCLLPHDVIPDGTLRVTEVGSGMVPTLLAINQAAHDVLLVDGEQLIGAKQNRMVNRTVLLGAKSETEIPVSCIEQGRWRFDSQHFASSSQHTNPGVRRRTRELEARRVASGMAADAASLGEAQGDVWASVSKVAGDVGGHSDTGALDRAYEARRVDLDELAASFPTVDGQVGLLVYARGTPLGLDLIGGRALYGRLHSRLLMGYLLDALGMRAVGPAARRRSHEAPRFDPQSYLDRVRSTKRTSAPTVGVGEYRVLSGEVVGGELVHDERVVHLAAFPTEDGGDPGRGTARMERQAPIPGPRRRRRRR